MSTPDHATAGGGRTLTGTVPLFNIGKQFGLLALNGGGDAFLHMSVLKKVGYAWIPRGTTLRDRQRVAEVLEVDPSTARPGEKEPVRLKPRTST